MTDEYVEPVIEHELEERTRLQQVLCDLSTDLSIRDIIHHKIRTINLIVALASWQEVQTRKPLSPPPANEDVLKDVLKEEHLGLDLLPKDEEFPLVCKKTQCIFCLGNERYSYKKRTRTLRRVSHMMDHVENVHLKRKHLHAAGGTSSDGCAYRTLIDTTTCAGHDGRSPAGVY